MSKYVHTTIIVNDVQVTVGNIQSIKLPFLPYFVVTESIDPPFTKVKEMNPGAHAFTYMGYQSDQSFFDLIGLKEPVHLIVNEQGTPPVTINSDLAFLASLDVAVERFGTSMVPELKSLLSSFITAEKTRLGFSS